LEVPELLTPAGAAFFAVLATQAAKIVGLPGQYARAFCLLAAVSAHVAALFVWAETVDLKLILAVVPAGLVAGMAGVAGFDAARSGLEYAVVSKNEFEDSDLT
jgi:hypothetical protein